MSEDDVAKSLIDALAHGGEHVDDGSFTLDPTVALRKLREHQLADPRRYLLLLVEAAWLAVEDLERGELRIELGSTTVVEFRGVAFERGALHHLFAAALGTSSKLEGEALRRARILQLLGLAANSALALAPKQITIEATDANGEGQGVRIDPSGALTSEPSEISRRSTVRFTFVGTMLGLGRALAERELLGQSCYHTRLAVRVNGELISRRSNIDPGSADTPTSATVMLDGRAIGVVGPSEDPRALTEAWIVNRGVAIADPLSIRAPVHAVVEVDLPTDLSHEQLLQGPELDAVRRAIHDAQQQVMVAARARQKAKLAAQQGGNPVLVAIIGFGLIVMLLMVFDWQSKPKPEPAKRPGDEQLSTRELCDRDVEWACYELGLAAFHRFQQQQTDDELGYEALLALERSCDLGFAQGCHAAGVVLLRGLAVAEDLERAEDFFERGCARGHVASCDGERFTAKRRALAPVRRPPLGPRAPALPQPTRR